MRPTRHLVIFVKAPRLGAVKTRLAADIGAVVAWRFYVTTMRSVIRRLARDSRWTTWLAVTPDRAAESTGLWPTGVRRIPQGGGDLGARMARPLATLPPGPAVVVGTDIPELGPRQIAEAFKALGGHDAVFGPATDGGYWLVGMKRSPRVTVPFGQVRWSTEHALADTMRNLEGRRIALLAPLEDVDDGASFGRWRARNRRP